MICEENEYVHLRTMSLCEFMLNQYRGRLKKWQQLISSGSDACVVTGARITHACLDRAPDGAVHVNLYAETGELMTLDHIVPKSKGGSNGVENMQPMTRSMNARKRDSSMQEFTLGLEGEANG